uniref:Uncharacterized protein n=1 Tax=Panstrongylus lignarius TaxID=156445 RepID=A0A224XTL6_9HEMI
MLNLQTHFKICLIGCTALAMLKLILASYVHLIMTSLLICQLMLLNISLQKLRRMNQKKKLIWKKLCVDYAVNLL